MNVPVNMPISKEEMTSLVSKAKVMAITGGSSESHPA